ncbi:MAG: IMP cyclohydrolase [Planctomycetota bacterium]
MEANETARRTFLRHLAENPYPGRGLVVGRSEDGAGWLLVYFIMGRSEHSRNRRFLADGDRLWTEAVDPGKVVDPSLIIYDAMLALPGIQIVSNGDQTRTVFEALPSGNGVSAALAGREREPDHPNYTPRITAVLDCRRSSDRIELALLKANGIDPARTDRFYYRPADPAPGLAYGLTTYMGDGAPLPSFVGDPLLLPLAGSPEAVLDAYWGALDEDHRVALAVKAVDEDGCLRTLLIRNRHA